MKKLLLITLILVDILFVPCDLGAQEEGCGEWKVRGQNQTWLDFVAREIPDDIDSVCIPVSCADMRLAGVRDSVRQITTEEKVELLFSKIRNLEAEINCLRIEMEGR